VSDLQKYDPSDPKGHLKALNDRMDANDRADQNIRVNVFYSEAAGSDPEVMAKIGEALQKNLPFGLKCQRSRIVFIPHKLKAYWLWSDNEHGPIFQYKDREDLISGVKMQYLSHKEFMSTRELELMAKIIFYERAIENMGRLQQHILSYAGQQAGPVEPGTGGIQVCGHGECDQLPEPSGGHAGPQLLPEPIRDAKAIPGDGREDAAGVGG